MFDCTQIALNETVRDFKKVDYFRVIITHLVYLTHTTIIIVKNLINGIIWWNLILYSVLTAITLSYLIFYVIVVDYNSNSPKPKFVTITDKTMKWIKRSEKVYSFAMTISAICNLYVSVSPLSIIMTALTISAFILQIVFEILIKILVARFCYLMDAIKADVNVITQPIYKSLKVIGIKNEEKQLNNNQKMLLLKAEGEKERKKQEKKELSKSKKAEKSIKIKDFFKKLFKKKKRVKKSDEFYLEAKTDDKK